MNATSFAQAIDSVRSSHSSMPLSVPASAGATECGEGVDTPLGINVLSPRYLQIAQCVSEGLTNKEIGRRLSITEATVKVHLKGLLAKLRLKNRTLLAAWWISGGRETAVESIAERLPRGPVAWDETLLDTLRRVEGSGVDLSVIRAAFGHLHASELQEGIFLLLRERTHPVAS